MTDPERLTEPLTPLPCTDPDCPCNDEDDSATIDALTTRLAAAEERVATTTELLTGALAEIDRLRAGGRCPQCSASAWSDFYRALTELDAAESRATALATENQAMRAVVEAARLVSATLDELALACEVYFDTDVPLPDNDTIETALVHAYRDQNNFRDLAASLPPVADERTEP